MAPTDENNTEKLTADNYHAWSFDMRMVLTGKDLWDIVDGTEVVEENYTDKQSKDFRKRDQKAHAMICLNVSADLKIYVRPTKTS